MNSTSELDFFTHIRFCSPDVLQRSPLGSPMCIVSTLTPTDRFSASLYRRPPSLKTLRRPRRCRIVGIESPQATLTGKYLLVESRQCDDVCHLRGSVTPIGACVFFVDMPRQLCETGTSIVCKAIFHFHFREVLVCAI